MQKGCGYPAGHALHCVKERGQWREDALSYIDGAWEGSPIHMCNREIIEESLADGSLKVLFHVIPSDGAIIKKFKKVSK